MILVFTCKSFNISVKYKRMSRKSERESPPGQTADESIAANEAQSGYASAFAPKQAFLTDESMPRWVTPGICALLAAMVWAVFGQTLRHEFVNYDDNSYVYENPTVIKGLTFHGVAWAFNHAQVGDWIPLTTISHMLDCQLFGPRPGGHHLDNVLLHATAAILLFLALRLMTGALWRSAFVAAVFAVHPLRVESVAWVSERKDVLSGVFFMLTVAAYARYTRKPRSLPRYLTALCLFAMGLMSKSMLVTLPFVLLLLDYWPLGRFAKPEPPNTGAAPPGARSRFPIPLRLLLEKTPFFALSAAGCAVQLIADRKGVVSIESLPFFASISNALVSCSTYIGEMIYPPGLAVFYPHPGTHLPAWEVLPAIILLASISAGVVVLRRSHPYLLVGWLWYLGMLVPVIGLIQAGPQAHADRYTYLPQIGLYIAITWMAADLCGAVRWRRSISGVVGSVVIAALIWSARIQTSYWKNSPTLWNHALAVATGNEIAHNNLGLALQQNGQVDEAIAQFQEAIAIKPDSANAYNNLGYILQQNRRVDEAIAHYQKALGIDPAMLETRLNLGTAFRQKGRMNEAIAQFQKAIAINPDSANAHYDLGLALLEIGETDKAIAQFQKVLEIEPGDADARHSLGIALQKRDK